MRAREREREREREKMAKGGTKEERGNCAMREEKYGGYGETIRASKREREWVG